MKTIQATENGNPVSVIVSFEDYEFLNRHSWFIQSNGYAYTSVSTKAVAMHDLVFGTKIGGQMIDHINRNRLDNRRENLRAVSAQQNALNRGKMKAPERKYKSPYVGVFHKHHAKNVLYEAGISIKSRYFYLGRFKTEIEAALQRDAFSYMVHGDLAFLNFPDKKEEYSKWSFDDKIMSRYEKWG